jgi:hypothetical protein
VEKKLASICYGRDLCVVVFIIKLRKNVITDGLVGNPLISPRNPVQNTLTAQNWKVSFRTVLQFYCCNCEFGQSIKSQHNKNLRKKNLQQIHTQIKITNVRVLANSKYCAVTISPNRHYIERELLTFNLA